MAKPEVYGEERNPAQKRRKWKRTEQVRAEQTEESKDDKALISDEAYSFWEKNLTDKGFIEERGFGTFISPFAQIIEKMGWNLFCKHKPLGFAAVVKEFYDNMIDMKQDSVYIREYGFPWAMKELMKFSKSRIPRMDLSTKNCLQSPIMRRL